MEAEIPALHRNLSVNLFFVWNRSCLDEETVALHRSPSTSFLYGLGAGQGDTHRNLSINLHLYGLVD